MLKLDLMFQIMNYNANALIVHCLNEKIKKSNWISES